MIANIPTNIEIGGFNYRIIFSKEEDKNLDDEGIRGLHSQMFRKIVIGTRISKQETMNVFLHEILHGIDAIYLANDIKKEFGENCITILAN